MFVAFVVVALDGGVLDGAVHPFDLAIGPRIGLGKPVFDAVFAADLIEAVYAHARGPAVAVLRQVGELDAVVREDGVQVVGDGLDQRFQERHGGRPVSLVVQLREGELRSPVDPDVKVELAFLGADLGDVDVEVANRVDLDFCFAGLSPVISGSRLMPWRWRQRCRAERDRCGMVERAK